MKNQLAIVCPTAHLESYVQSTFMNEPLISTALGTTFHTNNEDAVDLLAETIIINKVVQVSFVGDVNNDMLRKFLNGDSTGMKTVDRFYQYVFDMYEDHIMETKSSYKQRFTFLDCLIKEQVKDVKNALEQTKNRALKELKIDGFIVDRSADMRWNLFTADYSITI